MVPCLITATKFAEDHESKFICILYVLDILYLYYIFIFYFVM